MESEMQESRLRPRIDENARFRGAMTRSLLAYLYSSCLACKTSVSSFIRLRLVSSSTFVRYLELTLGPAPCDRLQELYRT